MGTTLLSDFEISEYAKNLHMIDPFVSNQISSGMMPYQAPDDEPEKIISYGLSSYGYDLRVADEYKVFKHPADRIVDPKDFDSSNVYDFQGESIIIEPHGFVLARSVEYMRIPRNIITVCLGKSTYARCGIIVNITALEPEWEGHVTIEISNTTPLPVKVYSNEGIAQILFFASDSDCDISYKDKGGKYQGQTGITLAR